MRRYRLPSFGFAHDRPIARHLFIVTLLGLPLITPLLRWTAVPCTHDGHLHYHRIAAMRHAWENGLYFTRWLPDLAFGYGYPFFVFREPTPLYLGLFPHLLGVALPAATNLVYIFSILAAGWFMYLWVRDILGARAAIVSAVAYMTAPYILVDALIRGNSPESVALPLFPFLLWIGRRWLLTGSFRPFIISTFGLAFLSFTHNISLLLFTPVLLVYLLAIGRIHRLDWRSVGLRLLLLLGLGLGMAGFYTVGALLEKEQVTLSQSTTTRNNDFHFNFTSLDEILAPVSAEDPNLVNPPLPFRLGWVPLALGLLGIAAFPRHKNREQRGHIILMVIASAVFLFMSLPISLPIWETLPLIDFVQFPWRFIGRVALPLAFLAGIPWACQVSGVKLALSEAEGSQIAGSRWQVAGGKSAVFFLAILFLLVETLPNLYPSICQEDAFPTINDVHAYEHESGLVGVDPEGSYFPVTVKQRPRQSSLESDYLAGQVPQRFDASVLPDGATVQAVEYGRNTATIHLQTPTSFTARYFTFAFPGWTAAVNGRDVPISASDPEGLITFAVPAGEHTLTIRWQATLLRTIDG